MSRLQPSETQVRLDSVHVVPAYTFFYWGFTLPKAYYQSYSQHFNLQPGHLLEGIKLLIGNKPYDGKIRVARIRTPKFPSRDVVQIFYDREPDTLKALRKLFIYSYAATIDKGRPRLKELMELYHVGGNEFRVKAISKQETDFDNMFNFLEDKNLFAYWQDYKEHREPDNFFVDFSNRWFKVDDLDMYRNRSNVVYLLYDSKAKHLYVGKANRLGERVKKGVGRVGLAGSWDRFMFFEIDPRYSAFIEQIEALLIRTFAALFNNDVGMAPLNEEDIRLVNRQLISRLPPRRTRNSKANTFQRG